MSNSHVNAKDDFLQSPRIFADSLEPAILRYFRPMQSTKTWTATLISRIDGEFDHHPASRDLEQ